jgi:hypothetical protein
MTGVFRAEVQLAASGRRPPWCPPPFARSTRPRHDGRRGSDDRRVTSQIRVFLPTGDASQGLGTHHASIEPAVLYYQAVTARVAVEPQAGVWLPFSGADPVTQTEGRFAGNVFFYGIGPSVAVYSTDRLRLEPVVELVGWRVLDGNQTADVVDAGGTNIVNLKLGARTTIRRGSFYVGYGFVLTDQAWYEDVL